jgi:hypothetical protein
MLRFIVQTLQDQPLYSSTVVPPPLRPTRCQSLKAAAAKFSFATSPMNSSQAFLTTISEANEASPHPVLSQKRRNPPAANPAIGEDGRAAERRWRRTSLLDHNDGVNCLSEKMLMVPTTVTQRPPKDSSAHHWLTVPTTG